MIKIFFDASVLFSALYSSTGASYRLAVLVQQKVIQGGLSLTVIEEVKQHLDKFASPLPLVDEFIQAHGFVVRDHITPAEIEPWLSSVDVADAHVIAGAVSMKADYLVSFDKKHLTNPTVQARITAVKIMSPQKCLALLGHAIISQKHS